MYHSHEAPVPSEPPCTVSVTDSPSQTGSGLKLIESAATDGTQLNKAKGVLVKSSQFTIVRLLKTGDELFTGFTVPVFSH